MADEKKPNTSTQTDAPKGAEDNKSNGIELGVESTAARDLRERLANGNAYDVSVKTLSPGEALDDPTVDRKIDAASEDDEYVGTDPIYQNHANDTDKPLVPSEGVWADAHKDAIKSVEAEGNETPKDLKDAYADRSIATSSDSPAGGTGTRTSASSTTTSAK